MNSFCSVKAWIWSIVIVTSLSGVAFAQRGHGGGGGHHGGGGHSGGHHGGWSGGGGSHHHHGGHYGGGYGGYYRGYSGFGFGFGGLGYGYGYGGYPYGYGSGYYYSTPRYYYYSTPTYVTPSYSYPSNVIIDSTPSVPAPAFDNGPIVILAPATNDAPVQYTLNGMSFTMKPGQSQKFRHDRDWIVEFDRGEGKGTAQYSLKASAYKFKKTDNGWELFEAAKPEPPVDSVPVAPAPRDDLK